MRIAGETEFSGKQIRRLRRLVDLPPGDVKVFTLLELFAITTAAGAAAAAVSEKIFFGRNFELLKVEY
jgi:hypothetical protein